MIECVNALLSHEQQADLGTQLQIGNHWNMSKLWMKTFKRFFENPKDCEALFSWVLQKRWKKFKTPSENTKQKAKVYEKLDLKNIAEAFPSHIARCADGKDIFIHDREE